MMTDDLEMDLARARQALRGETAQTTDTDGALAELHRTAGATLRTLPASRRAPARAITLGAAAAAVLLLIGGLGALAWTRNHDDAPENDGPATTPVTVPATVAPSPDSTPGVTPTTQSPANVPVTTLTPTLTTAVPPSEAPTTVESSTTVVPATPVPLNVHAIVDSTWLDASHGWVITRGTDDITFRTFATVDSGQSWSAAAVPDGTVGLHFADPLNGWADVGDSEWWSTHDGGANWSDTGLAAAGEGGAVTSIGSSTTLVVIAQAGRNGVTAVTSPVDHDAFTDAGFTLPFGAGPVMHVSVAVHDRSFWLVYNDRTVAGSVAVRDGIVDRAWAPPAADLGGEVVVTTDPADGSLWALATTGIWGGDMEHPVTRLYHSTDAGVTFPEVTPPPGGTDMPSGFEIAPAGTYVLAAVHAADGSTSLWSLSDSGATWGSRLVAYPQALGQLSQLGDHSMITTVSFDDGHQELWQSVDGGITWHTLVAVAPS